MTDHFLNEAAMVAKLDEEACRIDNAKPLKLTEAAGVRQAVGFQLQLASAATSHPRLDRQPSRGRQQRRDLRRAFLGSQSVALVVAQ